MAPALKKRKTVGGGTSGKQQIDELKFDPAARQEYLTGFHKRKLQRIKHAQEEAAKKEREEKVIHRKEIREERKRDLEAHVAEVNTQLRLMNPDLQESEHEHEEDGEDGEWGGIEEQVPKPDGVDEYVDEDKFTTVTIETMDDDPRKWDGEAEEDVAGVKEGQDDEGKGEGAEDGAAAGKKRVWTKEKPKKKAGDKPRKQKFRYESKAERQQTRAKQRSKNKAAAKARKDKTKGTGRGFYVDFAG